MKKLLTAALTAAALVLPAAVSYAAPAAKAASASHSGDAARQTDSRQSSAMNQNPYRRQQIQLRRYRPPFETAVKEKALTVFAVIDHQTAARQKWFGHAARESHRFRHAQSRYTADAKTPPSPQLPLRVLVTEADGAVKSYSTIRARWCRAAK